MRRRKPRFASSVSPRSKRRMARFSSATRERPPAARSGAAVCTDPAPPQRPRPTSTMAATGRFIASWPFVRRPPADLLVLQGQLQEQLLQLLLVGRRGRGLLACLQGLQAPFHVAPLLAERGQLRIAGVRRPRLAVPR